MWAVPVMLPVSDDDLLARQSALHVWHRPPGAGLPKDSVVNVTALVTLTKTDLDAETRHLPAALMSDVDQGLRRVLGL